MLGYQVQQGIFGPGGHGGGIFQTTVAGLGATEVGPRGQYSEATKSTQITANAILPQIGHGKIGEDGKLGDETCGAIQAIISSGRYSGWTYPEACASSAESYPAVEEVDPYYTPTTDVGLKLAMIAGGVLLALGGYYWWSTKHG